MNVFNYNRIYKSLILAVFLLSLAAVFMMRAAGKGTPAVALFALVALVVFIYTVHAWSSHVWVLDGEIYSKSIFGTRSIRMDDISDVTMAKMKGRYMFFLITRDRFIIISTLYERFTELRELLYRHIPAEGRTVLEKVSDADLKSSSLKMNIVLFVIFILYAGLVVFSIM